LWKEGAVDVRQVFSMYPGHPVRRSRLRYCPQCGGELRDAPSRASCSRCGHIEYRNPSPGVAVLVVSGDRVLIGKRGEKSFQAGKWGLPAGFVEFDEDFLTAAVRETREETNLDVRVSSILSVVSNFLAPEVHTLVVVLLAEVCGGTARAGDDFVELAWYTYPDPLPDMAFEADVHIIQRYFGGGITGAEVDRRYAGPTTAPRR
jgi:ADP-ribose pyrophosphatase YjhB (NUDIX family)